MTGPAQTADERDAEQVREWNTYEAAVPIDYFGTRAYNTGDRVPASAVTGDAAWIHEAWVRPIDQGTPNAGSQTAPPASPPTVDPGVTAAPQASTPEPPPDTPPAPAGGDTPTGA